MSFEARVAIGVKLLGEELVQALPRLDIDALDISDGEQCMLAQLDGCHYEESRKRRGLDDLTVIAGGFSVARGEYEGTADLTAIWKKRLRAMRAGA